MCTLSPGPRPPRSSPQSSSVHSHSTNPLLSQPVLAGVESSIFFSPPTGRRPRLHPPESGLPSCESRTPERHGTGAHPIQHALMTQAAPCSHCVLGSSGFNSLPLGPVSPSPVLSGPATPSLAGWGRPCLFPALVTSIQRVIPNPPSL